MTNQEAISYLCNLRVAIGRTEHQALWHYEQPLAEIVDMLSEEPKYAEPETHDKRTETHACVNERTETHDLISRKAAIKAVCSVCGDTECNIFDPDNKAKLYCPEPYAIMKLPSAEPNESDCWGCNCPKMERLNAEPKRKHGRWINITTDESIDIEWECSECGWELFLVSDPTNY